jgi:YVTN family beta-propeller protein
MRNALALALALIWLAAGLCHGQDHPQAPTPSQLQTLVEWPRLTAQSIAFTQDAIWVSRCDAELCGVTRVDASTNKIVTTIKTSQPPSGIAAGTAGVWAAIPRENSVVRIDPSTNQIVATIATGKWPTDVAAGEGGIWVANGLDKSVSRIDAGQNAVTATIRVGGFPGPIVISHGAVWVANGEGCWGCSFGTISRIDPATNEVVKTIKTWKYGTEVSPSDLLFHGGDLWAIAGEHVLRIDPETNKIVKWIRVPNRRLFSLPEGLGQPKLHGLAVIGGSLWVADSGQHLLWRIEMDKNTVIREPVQVGFPLRILGQREEEPASLWIDNQREGSTLQVKP